MMRAAHFTARLALYSLVLLALLLLVLLRVYPALSGTATSVAMTSSMYPAIPAGSLIYLDQDAEVSKGSIITFQVGKAIITHRVIDIGSMRGDFTDPTYVTKGDANAEPDTEILNPTQVIGVVTGHIPMVGIPAYLFSQPTGMLLFITACFLCIAIRWATSSSPATTTRESDEPTPSPA